MKLCFMSEKDFKKIEIVLPLPTFDPFGPMREEKKEKTLHFPSFSRKKEKEKYTKKRRKSKGVKI